MLKQNCVVKFVDTFGIEHAIKVEAGTLFEAAILGLQRLDSSFGAEMWDRMSITVEISAEPTTYASMVQKLKPWIQSEVSRPQKEVNPVHLPQEGKPGHLPLPPKNGRKDLKTDLGNARQNLPRPV
ncbi:MAG TPA: hypothetical protein VJN89_15610 [Candidatus Acidoferrum sp.]|nr:hypothetical protein [Candidatus Acidoferrum sp.]